MADNEFGGRVTFDFAGTKITIADAKVTLDPSVYDVSAKANQDGSGCYILAPHLISAKMTFRDDSGTDWAALMLSGEGNVTISQETLGRTHLFTKTRFTGKPDIDLSDGAVDGLMIEGGQYTRVNG